MTEEVLSILANGGAAGLLGLVFLVYIVLTKSKKNGVSKEDATQDQEVILLKQLLNTHMKSNEESFSAVHNGLNTMNGHLGRYNEKLNSLEIAIERLSTIIEERVPKKS